MGFNIGAVFAGAAQTISERVKEQEQRVNLLTDKALDLGTQVYLDKKKEAERDAKLLEQGMASLAMTGLDAATRFRIAQGGSTAVNNTLNQYNSFLEKDSEGDFSTFYNVKGADEFADMSDSEFISLFGPRAEYDPSIARRYLAGRGADGLGGLFVSDPAKQLSEFEAKAGVLGESRVIDAPTLGTLNIDMAAMQTSFGKDAKELKFDTPKEAITYYTQSILNEREKGDEANQDVITSYQGRITAFKNIEKKDEDKPFKVADRLDEIAGLLQEYSQSPEDNADKIVALEAEREGYLEHNAMISAAGRAPEDKPEKTLDNMLVKLGVEIVEAQLPNSGVTPEELAKKIAQRDLILKEQKAQTSSDPSKDVFTPSTALSYINSTISQSFRNEKYAMPVSPFSDRIKLKFGTGREEYISFIGKMENARTQLYSVNDTHNSVALPLEIDKYFSLSFDPEVQKYVDKFGDNFIEQENGQKVRPDYIKEVANFEDAKSLAQSKQLKIGDIVRYPVPGGGEGVEVWTGINFR